MTIDNLNSLKSKIITALQPIFPDIHVTVNAHYNTVHKVGPFRNSTGQDYYPYGIRSYIGMTEACMRVYWDKFYDRICGNGWMYGRDSLFKFDIKDGDCKYCELPTYLPQAVDQFIERIKKEHLELEANWNALKD